MGNFLYGQTIAAAASTGRVARPNPQLVQHAQAVLASGQNEQQLRRDKQELHNEYCSLGGSLGARMRQMQRKRYYNQTFKSTRMHLTANDTRHEGSSYPRTEDEAALSDLPDTAPRGR